MLLRIQHSTSFNYSGRVSDTVFEIRMSPRSDEDQTVLNYQLNVTPRAPVMSYRDGFGNRVDLFNLHDPYQSLVVETTSHVRTHRRPWLDRLKGVVYDPAAPVSVDALDFLSRSTLVDRCPELDDFVSGLVLERGLMSDRLFELFTMVREAMVYDKRATEVHTPLSAALKVGRGVCQDIAHFYIGACRALRIPARYVSGYVHHPGEIATHAWCQVWAGEQVGWVDVDPTAGVFVGDDHISTALGRDYGDVPPNRGVWRGEAEEEMDVRVTVEPIDQVPPMLDEWSTETVQRRRAAANPAVRRPAAPASRPPSQDQPIFPDQPRPSASLYRQQGQQQQQ